MQDQQDQEQEPGERYHPWRHAKALGVRILTRSLPRTLWGYWHPPSRTIVLDESLCQFERRCTLAHELVHLERGDTCALPPREEQAVHAEAARRLIALTDLAAAMAWTQDVRELADELWVDEPTMQTRLEQLDGYEHEQIRKIIAAREGAA